MLDDLIKNCEHAEDGSTINTGFWKLYNSLKKHVTSTFTVNHKYTFVDLKKGVHTQNVKVMWRKKNKTMQRSSLSRIISHKIYIEKVPWEKNIVLMDYWKHFENMLYNVKPNIKKFLFLWSIVKNVMKQCNIVLLT